ncbi:MAG: DUF2865 domain-containing protein [Pseudomonadota bacterium]
MPIGAAAILLGALPQPASAQNFFEQLFGIQPKPKPRAISRPQRPQLPLVVTPGTERWSLITPSQEPETKPKPRRRATGYRTMCVRMCDGFYFPIGFSTPRNRLRRDAKLCERRCPGQGRMFYTRSHTSIKAATDLSGKQYGNLKVAFQYRKSLKPGCGCRPDPWSPRERLRHAMYGSDGQGGSVKVLAGQYSRKPKTASSARRSKKRAALRNRKHRRDRRRISKNAQGKNAVAHFISNQPRGSDFLAIEFVLTDARSAEKRPVPAVALAGFGPMSLRQSLFQESAGPSSSVVLTTTETTTPWLDGTDGFVALNDLTVPRARSGLRAARDQVQAEARRRQRRASRRPGRGNRSALAPRRDRSLPRNVTSKRRPSKSEPKPTGFFGGGTKLRFPGD